MSDDIIVGAPVSVDDPAGRGMVRGSRQFAGDCGHQVWLAPTGQRFLAEHKLKIWCVDCALASESWGSPQPVPGALEEFGRFLEEERKKTHGNGSAE